MIENDRKQIKSLWDGGMPMSQIRRMISLPTADFRKIVTEMRENGDFDNSRKNTQKKVCDAFDNGERNAKKISLMYGITEGTVRAYLHGNGRMFGKKTRNYTHTDQTLDIVADLKEGALTQYKISQKYGVSRQYISQLKKKLDKGILDYD